jgi:hypothetical protein
MIEGLPYLRGSHPLVQLPQHSHRQRLPTRTASHSIVEPSSRLPPFRYFHCPNKIPFQPSPFRPNLEAFQRAAKQVHAFQREIKHVRIARPPQRLLTLAEDGHAYVLVCRGRKGLGWIEDDRDARLT